MWGVVVEYELPLWCYSRHNAICMYVIYTMGRWVGLKREGLKLQLVYISHKIMPLARG